MRTNFYKVMMRCFSSKSSMKAGVSLIAVLLFMLIATIAATATWKWITSEGKSSASRMLQREALQGAQAGIENARAWMTFHANDLGAVIKQFVEDETHQPINITERLRPFQRADQTYKVWITGVNTEKSTYKVKILSSGEARGNTRHNETAIFNVDGLYQVTVPHITESKSVNLNYAYYGGEVVGTQTTYASAAINGNWNANPPKTKGDWIVTGNAILTGDYIEVGQLTCIGGNLGADNGFVGGDDLYVGGNVDPFNGKVAGNVYVDGDFMVSSKCSNEDKGGFKVLGNMTVANGTFNVGDCDNGRIEGNLVMDGNSLLTGFGGNKAFSVYNDVWLGANVSMYTTEGDNHDASKYDKLVLGTSSESKVYSAKARSDASYKTFSASKKIRQIGETNRGCNNSAHACGYKWPEDANYGTFKIYSEQVKDDRYYLHSSDGPTITFREYENNYWKTHSGDEYMFYAYFIDDHYQTPTPFYDNSNEWDCYNATCLWGKQNVWEADHFIKTITGSPYCTPHREFKGIVSSDHQNAQPQCHFASWFQTEGDVVGTLPSEKIAGGNSALDKCSKIWTETTGCDGSKFVIPDPIVTAKNQFQGYAQKGCAASITSWDENLVESLNACYNDHKNDEEYVKQNFYNGFVVVRITSSTGSITGTLNGNFIIIATVPIHAQNGLPTAKYSADSDADNNYVFLYLEQGVADALVMGNNNEVNNMFIYTEGEMPQQSKIHLKGNIYSPAASCIHMSFQDADLDTNSRLIKALSEASILCDASVTAAACGTASATPSSSSSSTESDVDVVNFKDRYFISMAPQLGVSLESQTKSSETLPPVRQNADKSDVDSSFIVFPRVVSLPDDPYGSLGDYINIIPLNGSHLKKSDMKIDRCSALYGGTGVLPTSMTAKLYTAGDPKLTRGNYKCIVKANVSGYNQEVPFWVVVGASQRSVPSVSFTADYQQIGSIDTKMIGVLVTKHELPLNINIACPQETVENWTYSPLLTNNGTAPNCSFAIDAKPEKDTVINIFSVSTSGATHGTLAFQVMAGEGYNVGDIPYTVVNIASTATLNRVNATAADIQAYCQSHSDDCPDNINDWPNCISTETWVVPHGTSYIENYKNDSWTISLSGGSSVNLESTSNKCVTIIPNESRTLADVTPGTAISLKATAKARKRDLTVSFAGNIDSDKEPVVYVNVEGHDPVSCRYRSTSTTKSCTITVFSGELVSLTIDTTLSDNRNFSYWKCSGSSCPTDYAVTSSKYESFYVTDNSTTVYAHFGESDKHCFFDEFKNGSVNCASLVVEEKKYCIDDCLSENNNVCASAEATGSVYANAKWHLISGAINDIHLDAYSGKIYVKKDKSVTVMSTVDAGRAGTLKALVQLPRVSSSLGSSSDKVRNTGFLLRSNADASSYLMLNVYMDNSNRVVAQICKNGGSCLSDILTRNSSPLYTSASNMIMISAIITKTDELIVSAYEGNYYGTPNVYTKSFDLSKLTSSNNTVNNEYVGYRLENSDLKLYGIGWISEEYASECHETPPIVKCSFAAKAENGVIPTQQDVEPWVGHSGWFDSRKYNCEKKFYYYNGTDACGGSSTGVVACNGSYNFSNDGAGQHGYDGQKTAKAGLKCTLDGIDGMWAADPEDSETGESYRAHCGTFWTGNYTECTHHADLFSGELYLSDIGDEQVATFTKENLRSASLRIEAENPDNSEVEVWLFSESDGYGEDNYPSLASSFSGTVGTIDVSSLLGGSGGFDPEKVVQIAFKSKNTGVVIIKSVTSVCSQAVGVESCNVSRSGHGPTATLNVDAVITNLELVGSFVVSGTCTDPGPGSDDKTVSKTMTDGYSNNSDGSITLSDVANGTDIPPRHTCSLSLTVIPEGSSTGYTKQCSGGEAEDDVSCKTTIERTSVELGSASPTFTFELNHCPPGGCGEYEIKLGSETVFTGTCAAGPRCSASKSASAQTAVGTGYTYSVISKADAALFSCDTKSFDVVAASSNSTATSSETVAEESSSSESSSSSSEAEESSSSESLLSVTCSVGNASTMSNQSGKSVGDSISVTPYAVSGCNSSGCSYSVVAEGHTISPAQTSSTYDGGEISFADAGASGTENYILTISLGTESHSCTFSVTYESNSECSCSTYCGTGCENNIRTTNVENTSFSGCLFFTGVSTLSFNNGYAINGQNKSGQLCWDNAANCATALSGISTVDGGYYLKVANDNGTVKVTGTYNPCKEDAQPSITCGATHKAINSAATAIPITALTNCDTKTGCSYSVSTSPATTGTIRNAGDIAIAGSTGTQEYTVTVTNKNNQTASCKSTIQYVAGTAITARGKTYDSYTAGDCYRVTISTGGVWRCTSSQQTSTVKVGWFNGQLMTIDQWQSQSNTITSPGSGSVANFCVDPNAPSDLKCDTDYY